MGSLRAKKAVRLEIETKSLRSILINELSLCLVPCFSWAGGQGQAWRRWHIRPVTWRSCVQLHQLVQCYLVVCRHHQWWWRRCWEQKLSCGGLGLDGSRNACKRFDSLGIRMPSLSLGGWSCSICWWGKGERQGCSVVGDKASWFWGWYWQLLACCWLDHVAVCHQQGCTVCEWGKGRASVRDIVSGVGRRGEWTFVMVALMMGDWRNCEVWLFSVSMM